MVRFRLYSILFIFSLLLTSCSRSVYQWQKANTGVEQFVYDHNQCLNSANVFPFEMPDLTPGTKPLNIRADWNGDGVWAGYVPYQGAEPVMVNSLKDDSTVSGTWYYVCMRRKGYKNLENNRHTRSHLR